MERILFRILCFFPSQQGGYKMGNKAFDVTALGELLIDFTENGSSAQGNPILEANPGGAPCNVLAMLEKLGKKTAFIGKVGNDMFGTQLKNAVEEVGIDTRNLVIDNEVHTTLAFVHTYPDGDRDFSFYRNPGADMMLTKDEIQEDLIRDSRIFHFGTLSSTHEGVREATRYAIDVAKEAGCIVSFDPNLRPPLWKSLDDAKAEIEYGLGKCDILKISDNEVEFLFGTTDYDKGAALLKEKYNIPLILITLGKDGSRAYYKDMKVEAAPFLQEKTIETTGAGDTFCASTLNYVLEHGLEDLTDENLAELLTFANAAASLIPELLGIHLTQTFITLDLIVSVTSDLGKDIVQLIIVICIPYLFVLLHFIERRLRQIYISLLDQLRHETIQEGQKQCCDMCTVNIGIGHNDDLVITKLGNIKILMDSGSEGSDHCLDLFVSINLIQTCLLNIQDLTTQWKNRLCGTVSRRLGRTARGISLYDIDLTVLRILVRTVCKLSRK